MGRGRHFNRVSAYVCGDYIDVDIFPVFQPAGVRRARCRPTGEVQARLNRRNSERALLRQLRADFGPEDLFLSNTYREGAEPEGLEEAMGDRRNFIRRLKRLYRRRGRELKYIVCTERGERSGRWHHHFVLSGGVSREEIEACWGRGYSNSKRLQTGEDGLEKLSRYLCKSHLTFKRWSGSRTLTRIEPAVRDGAVNAEEMEELGEAVQDGTAAELIGRMFPGYELLEGAEAERNEVNHRWYIRFVLRRLRPREGPGAERRRTDLIS